MLSESQRIPSALDLKVNAEAGIYDVVAVFNWDDHQQSKTISLRDDLGLATKKPYLVFDFWEQKLKEISTDKITSFIPAHGTSVYVIRPVLERPQLLATSRHITGTVSIKKCDWDASRSTLIGISKIVPGAPYSLFIHVPDGISVSNVESDAEILFHKTSAGVLEVKFAGEPGPGSENIIHWSVHF